MLVPARLVGMTFGPTQPVDDVWVRDGTAPLNDPTDPSAVLEAKFADQHGLPTAGTVSSPEAGRVTYTGLGTAPEDFFYEGPEGTIFAAGELAIVYLPLADGTGPQRARGDGQRCRSRARRGSGPGCDRSRSRRCDR